MYVSHLRRANLNALMYSDTSELLLSALVKGFTVQSVVINRFEARQKSLLRVPQVALEV